MDDDKKQKLRTTFGMAAIIAQVSVGPVGGAISIMKQLDANEVKEQLKEKNLTDDNRKILMKRKEILEGERNKGLALASASAPLFVAGFLLLRKPGQKWPWQIR